MLKPLLGIAVVFTSLVPLSWSWAAEIALEADSISYEQDGNVVSAEGNVSVSWDNSRLEAGSVRYEQDSSRATASSGLRFLSSDIEVVANSADLLLDNETGLLENVVARVPGRNLTFGGRRVEKRLGRRYRIRDGYFTTCEHRDEEPPDWEITGAKVDLELDGYVTVRNGSVKLKGLPVVYIPYAIFPVKQHRQSGLLAPRLGTSNERGFIFTQPFFWAIDKKQDVTFALDVETGARLG
ncbi:MAG: LPS-assembly protein LptD, partial [Candidatus Binatia bacterium]